jgi:uncharacterized protein (TIGR03067 family)
MKLAVLALSALLVAPGQQSAPQQTAPQQSAPADDMKQAMDTFQGSWLITNFNGQTVPPEAEMYLEFSGDKYQQWAGNDVVERGAFRLDPKAKPMSIDLLIAEGSDAGSTQLGVVQFDGDTMTIGLATPGVTKRPATLDQAELWATMKKSK